MTLVKIHAVDQQNAVQMIHFMLNDPGNAFLVECHPAVIEALIGADGESVEELEHELNRGIYLRANFDYEFEEYTIQIGTTRKL